MPLRRLCLALVAAGWILLTHMVLLANSAPIQREARVSLPGWPAGEPPLRVVLLSDLHTAWPGNSPARLAQTADRIAALHPDLLLIAGDVLSNRSLAFGNSPAASVGALSRIHPRLGCFAVLGNHDYGHADALRDAFSAVGCRLLDNEAVRAGPLALAGIADAIVGKPDLDGTTDRALALGGVPVLFTHNPTPAYRASRAIPLALVGHTHCGQVPPMRALQALKNRYECGRVDEPERGLTTFVGAGLGTSNLPIRLGIPPDYWVLTLGR
jgi:uncharacterized protein